MFSQKTYKKVTYYDRNKTLVKESYNYIVVNGINSLNGIYEDFDEMGNIISRKNFQMNKLEGNYTVFLSAKEANLLSNNPKAFINKFGGKIWINYNYKNNLLDGKTTEYAFSSDDSKLYIKSEKIYRQGVLINEKTLFNENQIENIFNYNGECLKYFNNGKLESSYVNINGKKNGLFQTYYLNGNIHSRTEYVNGLKNGELKYYFQNGNLNIREIYENDIRIGNPTDFDESGNELDRSGNQIKIGEEKQIFENGTFVKTLKFVGNGNYVQTTYFDDKKTKKTETELTLFNNKDFMKNGLDKIFYDDGSLKVFATYITFRQNGQVYERKSGESKYFYKNGQIESFGNFKNDIISGKWQSYFENGNIKIIVIFKEDNGKHCDFTEYYENGNLRAKGIYSDYPNSVKVDGWKYYDINGNLTDTL